SHRQTGWAHHGRRCRGTLGRLAENVTKLEERHVAARLSASVRHPRAHLVPTPRAVGLDRGSARRRTKIDSRSVPQCPAMSRGVLATSTWSELGSSPCVFELYLAALP